jgi:hypothetical protein
MVCFKAKQAGKMQAADSLTDLQHAIDTQVKLILLLFTNKNAEVRMLEMFANQQAKQGETRQSTIELVTKTLEALKARLAELEEELKAVCAPIVEDEEELETAEVLPGKVRTKGKGDSATEREIDGQKDSNTEIVKMGEREIGSTLPGEEQAIEEEDPVPNTMQNENLRDAHEISHAGGPEPKKTAEFEKRILELKEQVQDLEAKALIHETELAAGRHREGNLRQENTRLLDERELLLRKIPKSPSTIGNQNSELDASRERERLALEKLKQLREHNVELKIARDVMRKKLFEFSTQRAALESALREEKVTSGYLKSALEESQANFTCSQEALRESRSALDEPTAALGDVTTALEESPSALGCSKVSLSKSEVARAESEKTLVASQSALESCQTELSEVTTALAELKSSLPGSVSIRQFQYATALIERWRDIYFSEREGDVHFLSQLTAAGAAVNSALRHTIDAASAGANHSVAYRDGVEPAMYRMMALINLEINRKVEQGQEYRDWVGLQDIRSSPLILAGPARPGLVIQPINPPLP